MKLTSSLKNANPLPHAEGLSPRGRAELRRLVGAESVPLVESPRRAPKRRFQTWLAPSLAAALVVGGLTVGMYASQSSIIAPAAFADTISVPAEVIPTALGASVLLDVPLPADKNGQARHWVGRIWYSLDPAKGWDSAPRDLIFKLVSLEDDVAWYEAQAPSGDPSGTPFGSLQLSIVGPESSQCFPSTVVPTQEPDPEPTEDPSQEPDPEPSEDPSQAEGLPTSPDGSTESSGPMITVDAFFTWTHPIWLCDIPDPYTEGSTHPLSFDVGATMTFSYPDPTVVTSKVSFQIGGLTSDPGGTIAVLKKFELNPDGSWAVLPKGYEDWADVNMVAVSVTTLPNGATIISFGVTMGIIAWGVGGDDTVTPGTSQTATASDTPEASATVEASTTPEASTTAETSVAPDTPEASETPR